VQSKCKKMKDASVVARVASYIVIDDKDLLLSSEAAQCPCAIF
jgi:hypothetical protein